MGTFPVPPGRRNSVDSELHNGVESDTCIENLSGAVLKVLQLPLPSPPRDDPRPQITADMQEEIRLNKRLLRQWQVSRYPL
jgi:hypothetical protein